MMQQRELPSVGGVDWSCVPSFKVNQFSTLGRTNMQNRVRHAGRPVESKLGCQAIAVRVTHTAYEENPMTQARQARVTDAGAHSSQDSSA